MLPLYLVHSRFFIFLPFLVYTRDMNNACNKCDSCGKGPCSCGGCRPARYSKGDIQITPNPFDASVWMVTIQGATTKVKIPKINETDTKLSTNYTASSLIYNAEKHTDTITGAQLGSLIKMEDLRDSETSNADSCDLLVYNPFCDECGDGCKPKNARWRNYHIPDAEDDCEIEVGDDGYYRVLVKDDCGCIKECRLPVTADGSIAISYIRDSVPDDPDFPWYYGIYNDTINLHLAENASAFFGKYPLEITVNYSIQVVHSTASPNTNFRSLLVPVVEGSAIDATMFSSILQDQSTVSWQNQPYIPWGTVCLRGSLVFYVPKGKEAYLHHEFRLRTKDSHAAYATNALDGQKVPDEIAGQVDRMLYTASRLNALQIIVKPARGTSNTSPVVDAERSQLDAAVDVYPNIG